MAHHVSVPWTWVSVGIRGTAQGHTYRYILGRGMTEYEGVMTQQDVQSQSPANTALELC